MRTILGLFFCLAFICSVHAQVLYSTTWVGGASFYGTICRLDATTNKLAAAYNFNGIDGANPHSSLLLAGDGELYGMTGSGGTWNAGVIYSFDPGTSTYTKLHDFDGYNGMAPKGSLIQASDGKLYGMTYYSSNGDGVIFSYNPVDSIYTKLLQFDSTNGAYPNGNLIQANDGKLYGMTIEGGSSDSGVIFSFDPVTSIYTRLHDFNGSDGSNPYGSLIQASDGKLYGMTHGGGSNHVGVIFSYAPTTGTFTKLRDFNGEDGSRPYGSLMQANDGKIYGMTFYGGSWNQGVIFSFDPGTSTYDKVYDFTWDGYLPKGTLMQASDGKLYGITASGGSGYSGVAFAFNPADKTYTKLADLNYTSTGSNPDFSFFTEVPYMPVTTYYRDADGDSYGDISMELVVSKQPDGYVTDSTDCDDTKAGIHPDATEIPDDNIDQDCDGKDLKTWYYDGDGDGHGSFNNTTTANTQPTGYVSSGDDCDDNRATVYPGAPELCDGLDNNCNGKLDEGFTKYNFFRDSDGDGYGNADALLKACALPPGYTKNSKDCNDTDASVHPGAAELPDDGIDQNCDGSDLKIWYKDEDGDGFGDATSTITANKQPIGYVANHTDCDDIRASVHPSATEICGNGIDDNCDGQVDEGCNLPAITVSDVSVTEGNSSSQRVTFNVTLSKVSAQTITVNFTTANGTATAPSDYSAKTGIVTFTPGVKKRIISIAVKGDVVVESDENFNVVLSNALNGIINRNTATGTIINDDGNALLAKSTDSTVSSLNVSPNPANSIVQVQLKGFRGAVTLQLTDIIGKVLKEKKLSTDSLKYVQQQFSIADVAGGTYLIVAVDEHGHKQSVKVAVAH